MPFSYHSHSGQFCAHAKGSLEETVQQAIKLEMMSYGLTEHIGRDMIDLYPEEQKIIHEFEDFSMITASFYKEAVRLREKYQDQIELLIGFESEWIRLPSSLDIIHQIQSQYQFDIFVGSIHHVHTIPIDFDRVLYEKARAQSTDGNDEGLFKDYFNSQLEMLKALKPRVIGHFDLIRLLSDKPNINMSSLVDVWKLIQRNLKFIQSYKGILEINTSGLRKGLEDPYPTNQIAKEFLSIGGGFTLSDDSHAVEHVGTNYFKLLSYFKNVGISELHRFRRGGKVEIVQVEDIQRHKSIAVAKAQTATK